MHFEGIDLKWAMCASACVLDRAPPPFSNPADSTTSLGDPQKNSSPSGTQGVGLGAGAIPHRYRHGATADIAKSSDERLWLDGLPDTVRLITTGQGFVRAGDAVQIVDDADAAAADAAAPNDEAQPATNDAATRS